MWANNDSYNSTNVGIADEILSNKSIMDSNDISTFKDSTPDVDFAFKQSSLLYPTGCQDI